MNSEFQYVGDALCRLLEQMVHRPLLEVDDANSVEDRFRRILVDDAPHGEVAEIEGKPDHDLAGKIGVSARQDTPSSCDDCGHIEILVGSAEAKHHPPMYDISTFGSAAVSALRSSE